LGSQHKVTIAKAIHLINRSKVPYETNLCDGHGITKLLSQQGRPDKGHEFKFKLKLMPSASGRD
jgi:hypothetical protein